jgi:hypothetical protein
MSGLLPTASPWRRPAKRACAFSSPILGSSGHTSFWPNQVRQRRASAAVSESTHGPTSEERRLGCLLIRHSPKWRRFRRKFTTPWRCRHSRPIDAHCRQARQRPPSAFHATPRTLGAWRPRVPTSLVPR